jgi:hypothetical protein
MEVICIDGTFTADQLTFWAQFGVKTPQTDQIVNIREVVKHTTGEIGFRLEEIINPQVPIKHPILGIIMMEPSWAQRRFTTLNGKPLNKEEIESLIKQPAKETIVETNN